MLDYDYREYLEKLLCFVKSKDSGSAAENLVSKFDTLECLLQIDRFLLSDTLCGNDEIAFYIRLISALTSRRITDKYKNGKKYSQKELEDYMVGMFFGADVETAFVLLFDDEGRLISTDSLGDGTVNASGFLPRKLIDIAVRGGAKSVIIAHNHPRGATSPSRSDILTTCVAKSVLKNADIKLKSHYIVAGFDIDDCISVANGESENAQSCLKNQTVSPNTSKKGK